MKKHIAPRAPRFDRQWTELINLLPDENERKLLTGAIVRYQLDATEPDLPAHLAVAFGFIRPTIDRRARARVRRRERMENQPRAEATSQAEAPAAAQASAAAIAPKPARAAAKAAKMKKNNTFNKIVLTARCHRGNPRCHAATHRSRHIFHQSE